MLFCPSCANVLLVEYGSGNLLRFCCQTCPCNLFTLPIFLFTLILITPDIFNITSKVTRKMVLKRKEVDQVIEDKSWDSVDQTEGTFYDLYNWVVNKACSQM